MTNPASARTPDSQWPPQCEALELNLNQYNKTLEDSLTFNKEKDLSQWFRVQNPKGYVLLVHGLNLKPSKMTELARAMNRNQLSVLLVSLTGHRGSLEEQKDLQWQSWLDDLHFHTCLIQKENIEKLPLYHASFSLGSLVTLGYLTHLENQPFSKNIMIAPAAWIHWYSEIPQYLSFFSERMGLPSGNLKEYRSQDSTNLGSYKAMAEGRRAVKNSSAKSFEAETLVFVDPKDELVSIKKLKAFISKNSLSSYWKIVELSNKEHLLKESFHHLIIDSQSLGTKEWERLLGEIRRFLPAKTNKKSK